MDEFETETDERELQESPATPPRWTSAPSIALAHQLNAQCIDFLCELATASSDPHLPPFILQNRDLWPASRRKRARSSRRFRSSSSIFTSTTRSIDGR